MPGYRSLVYALAGLAFLANCDHARAQDYVYATGDPNWATELPIEDGYIIVNNGEVHLDITLSSPKQRGNMTLDEALVYDSRIWQIVPSGSSYNWQPVNVANSQAGWRFVSGASGGSVQVFGTPTLAQCPNNGSENWTYETFNTFVWTDPSGTNHVFYPIGTEEITEDNCSWPDGPPPLPSTGQSYSEDSDGYYMSVSNYDDATIYDDDGNQVYPTPSDTNGNGFTTDANGNLVDTIGRTPIVVTTSGNHTYYDVLTIGGATKRYTVTTETIDAHTAFGQSAVGEYSGSFTAIQSIVLPDGSSYGFTYDSGTSSGNYGELTSISLPTGGVVSFGYNNFLDSYQNENRWLASYSGGHGSYTFQPTVLSQCTGSTKTGCVETMAAYDGIGNEVYYVLTLNNGAWNTGMEYFDKSKGNIVTTNTSYNFGNLCGSTDSQCEGSQYIQKTTQTTRLNDTAQTSQVNYLYYSQTIPKITAVQQWDYYTGSPSSTPTRETQYAYGYSLNGAVLPTQKSVFYLNTQGTLTQNEQTVYNYDYGSTTGPHGNVTSVVSGFNGQTVTTSATYDSNGMVTSSTDGLNHVTNYTYQCSDAYRSSTIYPVSVNGQPLQTKTNYDCSSDLVTSSEDMNGVATNQATTYTYYTSGGNMGRVQTVTYPDGGQKSYQYPSPNQTIETQAITSTSSSTVTTTLEAFGRKTSIATSDPYGDDTVNYTYDADGRLQCVSNPERSSPSPTDGNTCFTYDVLDRPTLITQPDKNTIQVVYTGPQATVTDENSHQKAYAYDAFHDLTAVWESGPSGPPSWETDYTYDALGHLLSATQNGTGTGAPVARGFAYDNLGRMTKETVPEMGTPSADTTIYSYDNNGNVFTRTDPRSVVTTYTYDALNRLTGKSYSGDPGNSPSACFQYDQSSVAGSGVNLVGLLTNEWTQDGTCSGAPPENAAPATNGYLTLRSLLSYDAMGRIWNEQQCTSSGCRTSDACPSSHSYGYDLAGDLICSTNGVASTPGTASSVAFSTTYDTARHLQTMTSNWVDPAHPSSLFSAQSPSSTQCAETSSSAAYAPFGGLISSTLGNHLTVTRSYDTRQRVNCETDIGSVLTN